MATGIRKTLTSLRIGVAIGVYQQESLFPRYDQANLYPLATVYAI
jgi:hypothetical protein